MSKRGIGLAVVLVAIAGLAEAQIVGRIVGPGTTRIQVAVSPLAEDGSASGLGARFAEITARNLTLSGYFQVLDPKAYIEGPTPVDLDQINFGNWSVLGAKALTKGTVRSDGATVEVDARIYDVAQQAQLGGSRFRGSTNDLSRMARQFADAILRYITGEPGPFDSKIAFASRRGGRAKEMYVMSVDGFDVSSLTSNRTINIAPSWSPDVSSILFTSFMDGNGSLYRLAASGGAAQRLSSVRGLNLGGRWSPDGRRIAMSIEKGGNSEIVLLDPQGRVEKQLTNHPEIDISPTWSPDGTRIAFVSARSGNPQIYVMNADGSDQRRISFQGSYNTSPNWSPRGDLIAYVTREGGFNVCTLNVTNNQVRRLTSGQGNNEDPSFSPDGRYLAFSSTRIGRPVLFLSDLSGAHQVQLTKAGGDDSSPSWSPRLP